MCGRGANVDHTFPRTLQPWGGPLHYLSTCVCLMVPSRSVTWSLGGPIYSSW